MNIILIILSVIFFLMLLIALYIINNLYQKNKLLISFIEGRENDYAVVDFLRGILELFIDAKNKIELIDRRGSFSTDDEVGFAFDIIKKTIYELTNKIESVTDEVRELEGKINVELIRKESVQTEDKEK